MTRYWCYCDYETDTSLVLVAGPLRWWHRIFLPIDWYTYDSLEELLQFYGDAFTRNRKWKEIQLHVVGDMIVTWKQV